MEYWNNIIIEKSWNLLKELNKKIDFILIGGWATYIWTNAHKSKDIDIIVDFGELGKIKLNYNLKKNVNLKKYEIIVNEVDVDIYVPYYSKLAIPIEDIKDIKSNVRKVENFNVVSPEILLILKQGAELERKDTEKGLKDRIDIMDILINCDIDFRYYNKSLIKHKLINYKSRLIYTLNTFREIKYIDLNPREFKLRKNQILEKLKS